MKPLPISSRQFGESSDFFHTIFPQEVSFAFPNYLEANYKNCVNNKGLKKITPPFVLDKSGLPTLNRSIGESVTLI